MIDIIIMVIYFLAIAVFFGYILYYYITSVSKSKKEYDNIKKNMIERYDRKK